MPRIIAFDIARLFLAPLFLAPRGIDRVDLALARHLFPDDSSPHFGILPTPWGMRAYRAPEVLRVLTHVQEVWAESGLSNGDPVQDARLRGIAEAIRDPGGVPRQPMPRRRLTLGHKVGRIIKELHATGMPVGRSACSHLPKGATYLNVGQIGLAVPMFFRWLERRPDVTCAIMLHDVIPLEYPELVHPGQADHHARMVRTAARHADCMIYTTAYARDSVNAALAQYRRADLPGIVRALPLSSAFARATSLPALSGCRYCVVVSTIEPRKNHAMLLRVWASLITRYGKETPHLVIVGARGFDAARILAPLDRSLLLRSYVHEVAGLSSAALASLVMGATGLLSPSWVEGFGLPLMEANLLGLPTIASNIAAHREIASDATILLPGDDDGAWERAVVALPSSAPDRRRHIPYHATETAYCEDLLNFLNNIPARNGASRQVRPAIT